MKNNINIIDRKYVTILKITLNSTTKTRVLRDVRVKLSFWDRKEAGYEASSTLRLGHLLPVLRRKQNPSEADISSRSSASMRSRYSAKGDKPFYIVTPNAEIISLAQTDNTLAGIINEADFSIPDSISLAQAVKFLNLSNPKYKVIRYFLLPLQGIWVGLATWFNKSWLMSDLTIIKGRELFEALIVLANKKHWRVVLLGDRKESAQKASSILIRSYKKVRVIALTGPVLDNNGEPINGGEKDYQKSVLKKINDVKPHLVFVGFGAPRQEKWIDLNLSKLDIGGAMAIGGSLDYVSGKAKLPPVFMSKLGLEWFWRLLNAPWRIKRIFTAFPMFPLRVFLFKLRN